MAGGGLKITAEIDWAQCPGEEVLAWEARRAEQVCRKPRIGGT
jgi:hypothetical protein